MPVRLIHWNMEPNTTRQIPMYNRCDVIVRTICVLASFVLIAYSFVVDAITITTSSSEPPILMPDMWFWFIIVYMFYCFTYLLALCIFEHRTMQSAFGYNTFRRTQICTSTFITIATSFVAANIVYKTGILYPFPVSYCGVAIFIVTIMSHFIYLLLPTNMNLHNITVSTFYFVYFVITMLSFSINYRVDFTAPSVINVTLREMYSHGVSSPTVNYFKIPFNTLRPHNKLVCYNLQILSEKLQLYDIRYGTIDSPPMITGQFYSYEYVRSIAGTPFSLSLICGGVTHPVLNNITFIIYP